MCDEPPVTSIQLCLQLLNNCVGITPYSRVTIVGTREDVTTPAPQQFSWGCPPLTVTIEHVCDKPADTAKGVTPSPRLRRVGEFLLMVSPSPNCCRRSGPINTVEGKPEPRNCQRLHMCASKTQSLHTDQTVKTSRSLLSTGCSGR